MIDAPNPFVVLRDRLGLSDAELAAYLGVPLPTARKWLRGERHPAAVAARLIEVLATIEALVPDIHDHFLP